MRFAVSLIGLAWCIGAFAQEKEPPRRYGMKPVLEIYKQGTPKQTLESAIEAINRDRYDYLTVHLIDPNFVDAQLASNKGLFDRQAREFVEKDNPPTTARAIELNKARIEQISLNLNLEYLQRRIKNKLRDDPQSLKELKKLASEGEVQEVGDSATVKHKDIKDRMLYLKKLGDRWYLENRTGDEK